MNPQATASPQAAVPVAQGGSIPQGAPIQAGQGVPVYDTAGAAQTMANFYQVPAQAQAARAQVDSQQYNARTGIDNSLKAQETANQNAIRQFEAAKQQQMFYLQKSMEASAYRKQYDSQGNTHIIGPRGNEVSMGDFVNMTGANPADFLKDSPNKKDQQFIADFNNYQDFMSNAVQAKWNKGKPANEAAQIVQSFYDEPQNKGLNNLTPDQVRQAFMSRYGDYFGAPSGGPSPYGGSFTPNENTSVTSSQYVYGIKKNPLNMMSPGDNTNQYTIPKPPGGSNPLGTGVR